MWYIQFNRYSCCIYLFLGIRTSALVWHYYNTVFVATDTGNREIIFSRVKSGLVFFQPRPKLIAGSVLFYGITAQPVDASIPLRTNFLFSSDITSFVLRPPS